MIRDRGAAGRHTLGSPPETQEPVKSAPIQHWYDANYRRARQTDGYGHLLGFISGDLVDVYRDFAMGVADLVPGWDGWEREADPDGVLGDVDTFARYMAVLNLAAQSVAAPEPFAVLVASVSERVSGLHREVSAIVTELCKEVDDGDGWWL